MLILSVAPFVALQCFCVAMFLRCNVPEILLCLCCNVPVLQCFCDLVALQFLRIAMFVPSQCFCIAMYNFLFFMLQQLTAHMIALINSMYVHVSHQ